MVSLNNHNNGYPSDCWLCSKFPWITWHIADSTLSIKYNPNLLSMVQNNAELVIFGCLLTLVILLRSHLWCNFLGHWEYTSEPIIFLLILYFWNISTSVFFVICKVLLIILYSWHFWWNRTAFSCKIFKTCLCRMQPQCIFHHKDLLKFQKWNI